MVKSGKSISIDAELWIKIEEYAKEHGFTISDAVEDIVRKFFEKREGKNEDDRASTSNFNDCLSSCNFK
jgi:Organiser of macrodomain of Terminus of chromosome.